jgi:hypothetical protein
MAVKTVMQADASLMGAPSNTQMQQKALADTIHCRTNEPVPANAGD